MSSSHDYDVISAAVPPVSIVRRHWPLADCTSRWLRGSWSAASAPTGHAAAGHTDGLADGGHNGVKRMTGDDPVIGTEYQRLEEL